MPLRHQLSLSEVANAIVGEHESRAFDDLDGLTAELETICETFGDCIDDAFPASLAARLLANEELAIEYPSGTIVVFRADQ